METFCFQFSLCTLFLKKTNRENKIFIFTLLYFLPLYSCNNMFNSSLLAVASFLICFIYVSIKCLKCSREFSSSFYVFSVSVSLKALMVISELGD